MILETFRLALRNISGSKMRTFLTMLGIIIGVGAVIVIVGLGNGMTNSVRDSFSSMGTNTLTVSVFGRGSNRVASVENLYAIADDNPDYFLAISPRVSLSGTVKVGTDTDSYDYTSVYGVNEEYLDNSDYVIAEGRGLQYIDMEQNKKVCVVGAYIARVGFGGDAIGQTIKVGSNKFRIVGVLEAKVDEEDDQEASADDYIFVPYTTAMRANKMSTPTSYTAFMTSEDYATEAKAIIEARLYAIFGDDDSYYISSLSEMIETMTEMISMVVAVLTVIAGISLLVGGIGIMNIMLVSVTERTREIGIRKALGAKESIILVQFVMEAAVTSALGGIIGIIFGYGISGVATVLIGSMMDMELTVAPSFSAVVYSFGISVGIGILFGYLPARRAARLNPIDALRYD